MNFRKSLMMGKQKRKEMLSEIYSDTKKEYTEDNVPINILNMFSEVLNAIPQKELELFNSAELKSLFDSALNEAVFIKKEENLSLEPAKN
jgi:hypothetical protein